ncbi:MAG: DMT family transporter [Thermoplasmata archaeon]|nr:DMT family transporter [Thermoplasmata archaeon]
MNDRTTAVAYALAAAALFGASAPLAKLLLGGIRPVPLSSLLYLGSGIGLLLFMQASRLVPGARKREAPLGRTDIPWLAGAILSGGVAAPIALLYGLRSTPAATASLLLNAEGAVTALIAAVAFREAIGRRVWAAVVLVSAAAALLTLDLSGAWGIAPGALLVVAACALWGLDNNLSRHLSAKDPVAVVAVKGTCAGAVSLLLALLLGEPLPGAGPALLAAALGLCCYGLSIVLFLRALRGLGAARTGAYFAAAPFIGAALSLIIFRGPPGPQFLLSLPLLLAGAWLLSSERHGHAHAHERLEHDHAHDHADGHHGHAHPDGAGRGTHAHPHVHQSAVHDHPHSPDLHHRHDHG